MKSFSLASQNMPPLEKKIRVAVITPAHMGTKQAAFMSEIFIRTESQRTGPCRDREHRDTRGCLKMETLIEMMLP